MSDVMMPSQVTKKPSVFDRFATHANEFVSRAWFFAMCVVLVVVWAPSYFLFDTADTWQLVINTVTTIVTFLLVALLQNTQTRSDEAVQHKLNALAEGLSELMRRLGEDHGELRQAEKELRDAVGLERRESS
ncbi:low affinity iron permease family protein [Allokutzneria oryzae]|uniref:Low affinity iron permease family protein n=1 Tax=Allokutzneria oryzae TaxID=1378989 RepID=A0ABV6A313_9PSEU